MCRKSSRNVYPPLARGYKKQCTEEDDVWRPEWRKDTIRQSTDGKGNLCAQVVGNRYEQWRTIGLERWQLHASPVQQPLSESLMFQKQRTSVHCELSLFGYLRP